MLNQGLTQQHGDIFNLPALQRVERNASLPLSLNEQAAWVATQESPDNVYLNMKMLVLIKTPLDQELLEFALNAVVEQREILRTTYHQDKKGQLHRKIHERNRVRISFHDIEFLEPEQKESRLRYIAQCSEHKRFHLDTLALFEMILVKLSEFEYALIFCMHHIIGDGHSVGILLHEIMQCYRSLLKNEPLTLAPEQITYTDYASWHHDLYHQGAFKPIMNFWEDKLASAQELSLPYDRIKYPNSAANASIVTLKLDKEKLNHLNAFITKHKVSLYIPLMAALQLLLKKITDQNDLLIETILSNRLNPERFTMLGVLATDGVALYHVNEESTVAEFLNQLLEKTLELNKLQQDCGSQVYNAIARKIPGQPAVGINFHLQKTDSMSGLPVMLDFSYFLRETLPGSLDLFLELWLIRDEIVIDFIYREAVFNKETIEEFSVAFSKIIDFFLFFPNKKLNEMML
jgi:hypothetical protein